MDKKLSTLNLFLNYWADVKKRPDAIDLGMGMPLPKSVYSTNFLFQELVEGLSARSDYQPQFGDEDVRSAIALYEQSKTGINYNRNNIMMIGGALRGFSLFIDEFSSPDTTYYEILPSYPLLNGYVESTVLKQGGRIVKIGCNIDGNLSFDHRYILSLLDKNSIVYLTNPNNPTGQYYPSNLLNEVVSKSRERSGHIIIDESCDIPYSESATYFNQSNVIRVRSFSKDLLLAGVRIGYIVASEEVIQRLSNRYMFSDGNAPVIVNAAVKRFLANPTLVLGEIKAYCKERQKYSLSKLAKTNLFDVIVQPDACYYLLAKAKPRMGNWEAFTKLLDNGVNIVPGVLFGLPENEAWLRICVARDISVLDMGLARIASTF